MDGYLAVWKKYADFNGRANRREFWTFVLINIVIGMVLVGAAGDAANDQQQSDQHLQLPLLLLPAWPRAGHWLQQCQLRPLESLGQCPRNAAPGARL